MIHPNDINDSESDAYNGISHSLYLAGVRHSVRTTSRFEFPVGEPLPEKPIPPAGTIELQPHMKQLSYTEQSRMFAKLNDLPGGAIETQTDEERQLILKGAKYLTQEEEKMVKLLAAPPSHIKKFKAC